MHPARALIDRLGRLIESTLEPLINVQPRRICIIDPPDHPNVGDSAIFLGELRFLRQRFPRAELISFDSGNFIDACEKLVETTDVIFLHGGGNFGDLYPRHHLLRLRILKRFPRILTIQFPQSIHFVEPDGLRETARVIEQHQNFHLLLRDNKSFEIARRNFTGNMALCPDMAFMMGPLDRLEPDLDFLCLLRTDGERIADHNALLSALSTSSKALAATDWIESTNAFAQRAERQLLRLWRHYPQAIGPTTSLALWLREQYAKSRVNFGRQILSRGRKVITDRLHGHIISCLLGIEHFILDSLDGKVMSFHETWTSEDTLTHRITSAAELGTAIARFQGSPQSRGTVPLLAD